MRNYPIPKHRSKITKKRIARIRKLAPKRTVHEMALHLGMTDAAVWVLCKQEGISTVRANRLCLMKPMPLNPQAQMEAREREFKEQLKAFTGMIARGMNLREISDATGLSIPAIKSRLYRSGTSVAACKPKPAATRRVPPGVVRFREMLDRLVTDVAYRSKEECWLWNGRYQGDAPRCLQPKEDMGSGWDDLPPARILYKILRGPIPEGYALDNLCENRRCCNPWHRKAMSRLKQIVRNGRRRRKVSP